jgi:hypothetical protein
MLLYSTDIYIIKGHRAANAIQMNWRHVVANPCYAVCIYNNRRLLREFNEIVQWNTQYHTLERVNWVTPISLVPSDRCHIYMLCVSMVIKCRLRVQSGRRLKSFSCILPSPLNHINQGYMQKTAVWKGGCYRLVDSHVSLRVAVSNTVHWYTLTHCKACLPPLLDRKRENLRSIRK